MKIAVIYNRESQKVINLFGASNREKYGLEAIQRIVNALKRNGHQVIALEGDKDLIDNLEEFMPRALKGERPGMAFNLSYGIQGQARYTHVPGILEMVGVPYVGSGPLAHSLALDKVVAKMIFVQNGLPTPKFAVLKGPGFSMPDLDFPIIVKPKNEAVSFGIRIVNTEEELRDAAQAIFDEFGQDVLSESYIEGREINVGLLGNGAQVDAFRPAELVFPSQGPQIYTMEDKKQQSGRKIEVVCPAPIDQATEQKAIDLAKGAFEALGCYDCARVDLRMDTEGNLYILEINSLPSLGEHGSYVAAAEAMGMGFPKLVNRLVEVASARYFGTPHPPQLTKRVKVPSEGVFAYLTERRDHLEKRVESWTEISSRSDDAVGIRVAADRLDETLSDIGLSQVQEFTNHRDVWTWESHRGMAGGTVLITHLDVPVNHGLGMERFRRDPEWLYGEGIGTSRAPLAQLEFVLRALRHVRKLSRSRIGVVCYTDEGRDCEESAEIISKACAGASRAILLNPGISGDCVIHSRRGQRRYRLVVEGKSLRLGESTRSPEVMRVLYKKLDAATALSNRRNRIGISAVDIKTEAFPRRLPHRVQVVLQVSYPTIGDAEKTEQKLRILFKGNGVKWSLLRLSDRPPMVSSQLNTALYNDVKMTADTWDIPLFTDSSLWPSAAGLVLSPTPVLCGMGPMARSLHTSQESVSRISLVQRSLLLAQFLLNVTESS